MRTLWFNPNIELASLQGLGKGNMGEHLGIEITEIGSDYLVARMPVDHRTKQPLGLLHGGASVVLAETLGSIAASLTVDPELFYCVGIEINANHIKSAKQGFVYGKTTPLQVGRRIQVWEINITNQDGQLICTSRITLAVLEKRPTRP